MTGTPSKKRKYSTQSPGDSRPLCEVIISDSDPESEDDELTRDHQTHPGSKGLSPNGDGVSVGTSIGVEQSSRQSASPIPSPILTKATNAYDIVFTLPRTDTHKTVAIERGDGVSDLFRKIDGKIGHILPTGGEWELELRFEHFPNKAKGGYLLGRTDDDTWRSFNRIVEEGDEEEAIGIFSIPKGDEEEVTGIFSIPKWVLGLPYLRGIQQRESVL